MRLSAPLERNELRRRSRALRTAAMESCGESSLLGRHRSQACEHGRRRIRSCNRGIGEVPKVTSLADNCTTTTSDADMLRYVWIDGIWVSVRKA